MGSDRSTALEHSSGPAGRATFDAADLHRIAMDAHGPTDAAPTGGLDPRDGNRILAALPPDVFATLEPHIEARTLERGLKLHRPGEEILDLYFPVRCLISITVTMRDGRTAEVGVVGSQEMVGVNAFMGGRETTQTEYVVQIGGDAVRIPAGPLRAAFDGDQRVRDVFLRYTQAMIAQISQNTGCSSLHSLEQRYARWLLECQQRMQGDQIRITQEFISEMLGVRRAGITEISNRFERDGIVTAGRGWTHIVDAARLEGAACECYSVLQEEYERLLAAAGRGVAATGG